MGKVDSSWSTSCQNAITSPRKKNEIESLFALSNHKVIYANLRKSKSHKLRLSEDKRLDGLARRTKEAF